MTTFRNPHDPENIIITAKIQEWVKAKMNLHEATSIQVSEVDCADPGCVDKETRITIISKDHPTKLFRIHKPIVYIRQADIELLVKNN